MAQVRSNTQDVEKGQLVRGSDKRPARDAPPDARFQIALQWIICGVLFFAALGFNFYRLGVPSIWFDEAFSVELARQPLPLLWHIIFGPEPNMELYYLFLHFWLSLTGLFGIHATEFVVRLPSALFAALSTAVVFVIGWRFLDKIAGVVAALLYLLNYQQLAYAQQTRAYALELVLMCIAWYALFVALNNEPHKRRWWIIYALAMVLAIYAHLFSVLILLAQCVAVGGLLLVPNQWQTYMRKHIVRFGLSLLAIALLCIPMLLESLHGAKTGWLPVPHLSDLFYLFQTISGYNTKYLLAFASVALLGLFLTGLAYCLQYVPRLRLSASTHAVVDEALVSYRRSLPVVWSLLCWLVIPTLVSYVVSHGAIRLFSARYLVAIVPPLLLLVGAGVLALRSRIAHILVALVLVLLAVRSVPLYYASAQVEDWNAASHWLLQQYHNNDGLICFDSDITQGCQISVEYYLHTYANGIDFSADSPGAFSWENFGPADPGTNSHTALDTAALNAYAAKHTRFFYIVGRVLTDDDDVEVQSTEHWLDSHYHFVDQLVSRTVTVRLYHQ